MSDHAVSSDASSCPPAASPGYQPVPGRLLRPWTDDLWSLPGDFLHRYAVVTRLLDRLLSRATLPVRVLEVGCNIHDLLPRLLDPALVEVRRCDTGRFARDPGFFLLPPEPPWPIEGEEYDAVVALEVLEHLPAAQRPAFVRECLRIARHGAILTCPVALPAVREAEELAGAAFRQRHGRAHPFLREHQELGLPTREEIQALMQALDFPHAVFDHAPVDIWLPHLVLAETLEERQALPELRQRFTRMYDARLGSGRAPSYRQVLVCAKTFDATAALEPVPGLTVVPPAEEALSLPALALQHLTTTTLEVLTTVRAEADAQLTAARQEHRQEVTDLKAAWDEERTVLLADHRDDLRLLQQQLHDTENDRRTLREQMVIFRSFVQALFGSRLWRWLAPLRAMRRWFRARGFDATALRPWHQLDPDHEGGQGHWIASGPDAYFLVPCALPAGPLRVRLTLTSDVPVRATLSADLSSGETGRHLLLRDWVCGRLEREYTVSLPAPSLALRFAPCDLPSRLHLERFDVLPMRGEGRGAKEEQDKSSSPLVPLPSTLVSPLAARPSSFAKRPLDIVYVLRVVGLCGGVKVVMEHVSGLRQRGHNAVIYGLEGNADWFPRSVPVRIFEDVPALRRALAQFRGIKVATWHETAPWVADSLQPGDRGYYLVQDIEDSYTNSTADAAAVLQTYTLGLRPITEGTWVRDQLKERFGLDSVYVSIGLDLDLFRPRPVTRDPQRIMTQTRTWSGGGAAGRRLKGWETARDTILECRQLHPHTSLLTFSMEERQAFPPDLPHLHFRLPSDDQLAQLYSRAGVYLLTSTHEGFGLTAAEAMACGCPVVATRAHGNEEFCLDGETALLAEPGDAALLARHCHRLQTDPELARELGANGHRFIQQYTWDRVLDRLEEEFCTSAEGRGARDEQVTTYSSLAPHPSVLVPEYPDLLLDEPATVDWAVVVPTINDAAQVAPCIASCREHAKGRAVEFIVVDDGTPDAAVRAELQRLSQELDFRLLFNHQNLGFSAAVNHGMRQARGRFVLLCNNDVRFFQPWAQGLERAFADPRVGIAGARLLYPDGTLQHAGMDKVPGQLRWHHAHGREPGDHPPALRQRFVWCVTGALFAVRRETLQKLGGLSTGYGTAWEDVDYCLHAWTQGIYVRYCGAVAAYHAEGGTRGATVDQKSAQPLLWQERERAGSLYFARKWRALRDVEDFLTLLPFGQSEPETTQARRTSRVAVLSGS